MVKCVEYHSKFLKISKNFAILVFCIKYVRLFNEKLNLKGENLILVYLVCQKMINN